MLLSTNTFLKYSHIYSRIFFIFLFLHRNCVKGLRVTKIFKEIKFEGVWNELESKKILRDNNSQNISE